MNTATTTTKKTARDLGAEQKDQKENFLAAHDEVSRHYTDLWQSPMLTLTPTQSLSVA